MTNFLIRICIMTALLTISSISIAGFNETVTLNNNTNKYLIIQETIKRQVSSSGHKYTINPKSTKSWTITINPLSNINEWFYEFSISAASNTHGSDAVLFSIVTQDVEGTGYPYASNLSYTVSGSYDESYEGSLLMTLNIND